MLHGTLILARAAVRLRESRPASQDRRQHCFGTTEPPGFRSIQDGTSTGTHRLDEARSALMARVDRILPAVMRTAAWRSCHRRAMRCQILLWVTFLASFGCGAPPARPAPPAAPPVAAPAVTPAAELASDVEDF